MDELSHEVVREALADDRRDDAVEAHLSTCDDCRAFAAALEDVDLQLASLPAFEAPEALVARTRAAIDAREERVAPETGAIGVFAAIGGGLVAGLGALLGMLLWPVKALLKPKGERAAWAMLVPAMAALALVVVGGLGTFVTLGSEAPEGPSAIGEVPDRVSELVFDETSSDLELDELEQDDRLVAFEIPPEQDPPPPMDPGDAMNGPPDDGEGWIDGLFWRAEGRDSVDGRFAQLEANQRGEDGDRASPPRAQGDLTDDGVIDEELEEGEIAVTQPGYFDTTVRLPAGSHTLSLSSTERAADDRDVEGLSFRSPTGYWANTYAPGDSEARHLRERLRDDPVALRLAELAEPVGPTWEAPRSGALSLAVEADRRGVDGRSRVRLSVGLRGAAQRAGRRPALTTEVVLDLRRPLDEAAQGRARALLSALSRRHEGGDRIGLIVVGPDGGERFGLGAMRFGEVSVALRRAFGDAPADASALAPADGLSRAVRAVAPTDEDAPLGSSMVLWVTPGLDDATAQALRPIAHTGALAGVTTTVVSLAAPADPEPASRIALAGQGRRRILARAADADALVRAEITAVSRVVARAVRLRIRLAEGVQLVDVLGSRPLDETESERVRAAEASIDRALAASLGITSDRDDDEDGIQIVVPAFYADDSHRVVLDLVVAGPGPVADVQVRFKDLVRLGNGTLTERLVLDRGPAARGPTERAVMVAALGHEIARALRIAAGHVHGGRPDAARAALAEGCARVEAAAAATPALTSEPSLTRDLSLCRRYREALDAPSDALGRSLRYAAFRRLLGDPLGLGPAP